jgi:hypothetical protein
MPVNPNPYLGMFDWSAPTPAPLKSTNYGTQSAFNPNPVAQTYNSTYGGIPGDVGIPQPSQDLSNVYPNLSSSNAGVSPAILGQLGGSLSPSTQALLQDQGAAFGVQSGMPGSGLARNRTARDLGLFNENLINQGIQNYTRSIPAVSSTQTVNPALQASIAERNANINSAPNPANSQSYAQNLFDNYMRQMRGPGGGTGGGPASGSGMSSDQLFPDQINNSLFSSGNPSSGYNSLGFGPGTLGSNTGNTGNTGNSGNTSFGFDSGLNYNDFPVFGDNSLSGVPYDNSFDNTDWLANFQPEG